jgi:signal transduction histidine kinase
MAVARAPWRTLQQWGARFTSVRWRLTLWYVGMLTVALLVFGGIVYAWQAAKIEAQLRDDIALLQRQAGQFSVGAVGPPGLPERGTVEVSRTDGPSTVAVAEPERGSTGRSTTIVSEPAGVARVSTISVADTVGGAKVSGFAAGPGSSDIVLVVGPQGQIVQSSGPIGGGDVQRILAQTAPGDVGANGYAFPMLSVGGSAQAPADYQFFAQHIMVGDGGPGTLILGRPSAAVGELQRLMMTLFAAGIATLLVVGAGSYWLAGRAMRPVRVITRAAREIGETDLSRRLDLPNRDELGELAATFDSMLARLEAAFQRQRQFTNDASHELRTPLTIVELEVERALARPALPPEQAQALATIRGETASMARLVNGLLTLARADAGQAPLVRETLDLGDLALDVVERFALLARQQGVEIVVEDLPELPIAGDRQLLTQMLGNLLENAVKYTAGHGRQVSVAAGRRGTGRTARVWLRVADDGPGIAAEHLPHLFDRFYRVDQNRTEQDGLDGQPHGSGLGLAIARWAARAHGGDVQVESEVGQGSAFAVWLPIAAPVSDGRGMR